MSDVKYPEHEKLQLVRDKSQTCGEFLEWLLKEKGMVLGTYQGQGMFAQLVPQCCTTQALLGEYFNINTKTLEREKMEMLRVIRENPSGISEEPKEPQS